MANKRPQKKEFKSSKSVYETRVKNLMTPVKSESLNDISPSLLRRSERIEVESLGQRSQKHIFQQKFRDFSHSSAEEYQLQKIKEVEATKQSLLSLSKSQTREKEELKESKDLKLKQNLLKQNSRRLGLNVGSTAAQKTPSLRRSVLLKEDQISQLKSNLPGYKFSNLTNTEKQARINYLWGRLRAHVLARKFVFKTAQ